MIPKQGQHADDIHGGSKELGTERSDEMGTYDIDLDNRYTEADSFVDRFEVMIMLREIQEVPSAT